MPGRRTGLDPLSRGLAELRDGLGLRQVDAAGRAGISQSLLAKFEGGRQIPRPDQVRKLCDAYAAPEATRADLVQLAEDARPRTERVAAFTSGAIAQARLGRIQETASEQRLFSPSGLPGLLQTRAYLRAIFGDDEEGLTRRLENQRALDDESKRFGFMLPEGSLGVALAGPADMAEQMDHMTEESRRDNVALGIIPWGIHLPSLPLNSWTLFDDRLAVVGTVTRVAYLTVREDLDAYAALYDRLSAVAAFGDQAREILSRVADRYREAV